MLDTMADGPTSPKRVCLKKEEIESLPRDELLIRWKEQEMYVNFLEEKSKSLSSRDDSKESEEKLKQQHIEAARRENTLVMRLTSKEQELQEYMNQIQEMKQSQSPSTAQLRSMLLDPAVNLVFLRMKKEMEESKEKLEQTQNELSAWKFTPDSQTGKRLMAKCRMLHQENEELGKVLSSGRIAKLEGEIALEKTLVQEMKKSQAELDEFLGEIDEDVEGMQSMICVLQKQLKEAKERVSQLQEENELLKTDSKVEAAVGREPTDSELRAASGSPDRHSNHSSQTWPTEVVSEPHREAEEIRSLSEAAVTDNHVTDKSGSIDTEEEDMEMDCKEEQLPQCEPAHLSSPQPSLEHSDHLTASSNHTSHLGAVSPSADPPRDPLDPSSPDTRTSSGPEANLSGVNGEEVRTSRTKDEREHEAGEQTSEDLVHNGIKETWQQAEGTV
ncbi:pre-mRNA-splicing regulator WTAP-like isoform X2 [Liolophura sinensis]|uniref:pre-mRNA-splicing regulator WTAP-like isoform X2 n=1 Tax=Liolophura sinensis TaxID=3198878 RepID=UPI0031585142